MIIKMTDGEYIHPEFKNDDEREQLLEDLWHPNELTFVTVTIEKDLSDKKIKKYINKNQIVFFEL